MNTNGGQHVCDQEGYFAGFGFVYYNLHGIANILSMGLSEAQGLRIQYSSASGRYCVYNPSSGTTTFFSKRDNLYLCDMRDPGSQKRQYVTASKRVRFAAASDSLPIAPKFSMVNTVSTNKALFSRDQI